MTQGSSDDRLVSVIIPARNEGARIESCLRALAEQDIKRAFEVIVVDNGSADDTATRAAAFPVTVIREPRPGRAVARNAGIRAARGDMLCFTDADCVPRTSWLRELLAGSEDPAFGCFVGEIEPLDTHSVVAQHIHQRRLINQLRLLSQSPPVAATGNIAYRRSVFERIGMFDEAFAYGEDGDLFWRMVRSEGFRYRYNPKAVVLHPHPSRILEFTRRSFREGTGLARFRRKHREYLPASFSSAACAAASFLKICAGCALYPARFLQALTARRLPLRRALTEPFLDKVGSVSRMAGVLHEYRHGPAFEPKPDPAALDRTSLDLATARLLHDSRNGLSERVRDDLDMLGRSLVHTFPGSSVLLTGSLFVGEGRTTEGANGENLQSDYDFFVVTPRLTDAIPALARPKLDRLMAGLPPLCAHADIGLVWKPLLKWRRTTVGGAVIAGSDDIAGLLRTLPAPRGFSTLFVAYRRLAAAPLEPERYADRCASALVRAARAALFAEKEGLPRREWIALFSAEVVAARIEDWAPVLGDDVVESVRDAASFLMGTGVPGPDPARHEAHVQTVRRLAAYVRLPRERIFAAKQFHRVLLTGQFGLPGRITASRLLEGLQALADSWTGNGPDPVRLVHVARIADELRLRVNQDSTDDPRRVYESLHNALFEAACYNPHRVVYSRNGGGR